MLRGEIGPTLSSTPTELPAITPPSPEAYSLEAVPGSSSAPQVLSQGIQELTQLLRVHNHLLPDQLQMLWGHRASEQGCLQS